MSAASDKPFKYKLMGDARPLGPPHQRFPDMYPERPYSIENDVFLEIGTAADEGFILAGLAGMIIFVSIFIYVAEKKLFNTDMLYINGFALILALLSLFIPSSLPIRLHRPLQLVIFCHGKKTYMIPWPYLQVRIIKTVNIRDVSSYYSLQFGIGEPKQQPKFWLTVGGADRYEETALRDWGHFCRYLESGPVLLKPIPEDEKSLNRRYWEEDEKNSLWGVIGSIFVYIPDQITMFILSKKIVKKNCPRK